MTTIAMSVSAAVVLVGTFLPWVRTGARDRSSYLLLDLVDRLGFASGSVPVAAIRVWPVVPVILVGAAYAAWMQRRRLASGLGLTGSLYAGGLAVIVRQTPTTTLAGVDVVIAGGLALFVASLSQLRAGSGR